MNNSVLKYMYRNHMLEEEKEALEYQLLSEKEIKVREYDQAVIVAKCNKCSQMIQGVYTAEGAYIPRTGAYARNGSIVRGEIDREETTEYVLSQKNIEKKYEYPVIYLGYMMRQYGHFLVESASRLWPKQLENNEYRYAILIDWDPQKEMPTYMKHFMELLGIDSDNVMIIDGNYQFSKVYIPDCSHKYADYYTKEYVEIFDRIIEKNKLSLPTYKKIYMSRVHFAQGGISHKGGKVVHREYGEKIIESIFKNNGFKILYPEELSLKEQIHYINNCELMVTTKGTIAHNIIWAKENTKLVVLNKFQEVFFGNYFQKLMNDIRSIDYQCIDAYAKGGYRGLSLLIVSKPFKKYLKDSGFKLKYSVNLKLDQICQGSVFYGRLFFRRIKKLLKK